MGVTPDKENCPATDEDGGGGTVGGRVRSVLTWSTPWGYWAGRACVMATRYRLDAVGLWSPETGAVGSQRVVTAHRE